MRAEPDRKALVDLVGERMWNRWSSGYGRHGKPSWLGLDGAQRDRWRGLAECAIDTLAKPLPTEADYAMPKDQLEALAQRLGVEPATLAYAFGFYVVHLARAGVVPLEVAPTAGS